MGTLSARRNEPSRRCVCSVCFPDHLCGFRWCAVAAAGTSPRDDHPDGCPVLLKDRQDQTRHRIPQKPLLSRGPLKGGTCTLHHRPGDAAPPRRAQCLVRRGASNRYPQPLIVYPLTHLTPLFIVVCGDIHGQYVRALVVISPIFQQLTSDAIIVRPHEAVRNRRQAFEHTLSLPRGLRRQGLFQH